MKNLLNCRTLIKVAIMIVVVALIGSQMIDTYSGGGNNKKGDNGSDDGGTTSASGFDQFEDGDNKVTICHSPPGNPANAHTIIVGVAAADAHLQNHEGDFLGPCSPSEVECVAAFDACVFRDEGQDPPTSEEEEACAQDLALCLAVSDCDDADFCRVARALCEASEPEDPNLCEESFLSCLRGAGCLSCGDGFVDEVTGEECDDGNTADGDGCSSGCLNEAICGNGVVEAGEECDDSNTADLDGCSSICQTEHACVTNPSICDDGNECTDDSCDPVLGCINTSVADGSLCDDGDGCTTDDSCGGGSCIGIPVSLDDGIACTVDSCDPATGIVTHTPVDSICDNGQFCDGAEFCDEAIGCVGGTPVNCDDGNDCTVDSCTPAGCVNDSSTTDGNLCSGGVCFDGTCEAVPVCGNGVVEAGEQCDDGVLNGQPNQCNTQCSGTTTSVCGNSVIEAGEACDDGGDSLQCDDDCTAAHCGDGYLNEVAGEECDDGNGADGDGCNSDCLIEFCGDGTHQTDLEECDDGNTADEDGCSSACLVERCGDGILQAGLGEECDDGGTVSGDGCDSTCQDEVPASVCGNGIVEAGEECDDGVLNGQPNQCNTQCSGTTTSVCGNSVTEAGEECDDGNTVSGDGCSSTCQFDAVSCDAGFANCDGNTANGCELQLSGHSNTFGTAQNTGQKAGDQSCGTGCPSSNWQIASTHAGTGGKFFRYRVLETSACTASIAARLTLSVPAGVDYDLYVWASDNTFLGSSTLPGSNTEQVTVSKSDTFLVDDDFDIIIEVRYHSGSSCSNWSLTIEGTDC